MTETPWLVTWLVTPRLWLVNKSGGNCCYNRCGDRCCNKAIKEHKQVELLQQPRRESGWHSASARDDLLIDNKQVTWLVVAEVRSASFGLVLHVQHMFANFLVTRGLPVTVFHSTVFDVYILCIRYGTVLANTNVVLCMRVRIVCLPVRGASGEWCCNIL